MEIRKHKMLIEGIGTQQRLMGRQLADQRIECGATVLNQNSNAQIQQYQIRINDL
jgi:hypothetical protein